MTASPLERSLWVGFGLSALCVAATVAFWPSGAGATAHATVTPYLHAALTAEVDAISGKVLGNEGLDPQAVVAVAPRNMDPRHAGVFVATDSAGEDVAAVYTSDGMTGFRPLARVRALDGILAYPSASGAAGSVRRVALVGLATPDVAQVLIQLADGESLEAELVEAGKRGFRVFAYAETEASRFPVSYSAFDGAGRPIKSEDVRAATMVPCSTEDCRAKRNGR